MIKKFLDSYNCRIGYSDHCEGFSASLSAVANGASIIEKHITTNTSLNGPDHSISIEKEDLKNMIQMCNEIFHSLGNEEKNQLSQRKKI